MCGTAKRLSGEYPKKEPTANLLEAGAYWAEASIGHPNLVKEDLAALGISLGGELAEEAEAENAEPDVFDVLPENWQAVETFLRCSRQWLFRGMEGCREGLDVKAVISVLSLYRLPPEQQLERLDQVQLIERGALSVMNQTRN
ncbi:DUF1799 domain-containing protein [Vreelandella maris]|uniref:DUF1799 domain-containing protein n=1 Tax=Vreelandella maris TaxID=2729617 RepID=A0A7Y6RGP3_9GAMM|nr:DUF1799 domain-containing protein [Halomonas maris]NVF16224.1 DUF1799 domain-containing protein [Halomonas maris]